jgi:cytosine/adenosine deaminase-related metal-dependent hydrolase
MLHCVKFKPTEMKITQIEAEKYADWLLTECSDPKDEITWLVSTIQESDNDHVIQQVFEDMRKYNEL